MHTMMWVCMFLCLSVYVFILSYPKTKPTVRQLARSSWLSSFLEVSHERNWNLKTYSALNINYHVISYCCHHRYFGKTRGISGNRFHTSINFRIHFILSVLYIIRRYKKLSCKKEYKKVRKYIMWNVLI